MNPAHPARRARRPAGEGAGRGGARAALFDMDGVLIDSMDAHRFSHNACLREIGIRVPENHLDRFAGQRIDAILRQVTKEHGVKTDLRALVERRHALFFQALRKARPVPGAAALVRACKKEGWRTALASASTRRIVDAVLARLGLEEAWDAVVSGDEVAVAKPDPAIFLKAAEKVRVSPRRCVVLEDADLGVQAAKAAGMACLGLRRPASPYALKEADRVVESLEAVTPRDLAALLEKKRPTPKAF